MTAAPRDQRTWKPCASSRRLGGHVDAGHLGGRRAVTAPRDGLRDGVLRALEVGFDGAVGAVAHPPGQPEGRRLAATRLAEPDALDEAVHDHAVADALTVRRGQPFVGRGTTELTAAATVVARSGWNTLGTM